MQDEETDRQASLNSRHDQSAMTGGLGGLEEAFEGIKLQFGPETRSHEKADSPAADFIAQDERRTNNQDEGTRHVVAADEQEPAAVERADGARIADEGSDVEALVKGRVKWFNVIRGYGFVTREDGGPDVFVYQQAIQKAGYRTLGEGEVVEMKVKQTDKGPEALLVTGPSGVDVQGSLRSRNRRKNTKCYNCGELGHIAKECSNPPSRKCHLCGEDGHMKADCPRRAAMFPTWYQYHQPLFPAPMSQQQPPLPLNPHFASMQPLWPGHQGMSAANQAMVMPNSPGQGILSTMNDPLRLSAPAVNISVTGAGLMPQAGRSSSLVPSVAQSSGLSHYQLGHLSQPLSQQLQQQFQPGTATASVLEQQLRQQASNITMVSAASLPASHNPSCLLPTTY